VTGRPAAEDLPLVVVDRMYCTMYHVVVRNASPQNS
jgi:hypothetical protein